MENHNAHEKHHPRHAHPPPGPQTGRGHRTGTICHLLNIGLIVDKKLEWDPKAERITNSAEANAMLARPMRPPWHLQSVHLQLAVIGSENQGACQSHASGAGFMRL